MSTKLQNKDTSERRGPVTLMYREGFCSHCQKWIGIDKHDFFWIHGPGRNGSWQCAGSHSKAVEVRETPVTKNSVGR